MSDSFRLETRWLVSGVGEPIPHAVLEVTDGVVTGICSGHDTGSRAVVIPPLVNVHAHIELSDVETPFPPGRSFPDWIQQVIGHRRERASEQMALDSGLAELSRSGTVRVADVVSAGQQPYSEPGLLVHPFVEYIGLDKPGVDAALQHARSILSGHDTSCGSAWGISPHAPYSVQMGLLEELCRLARDHYAPVMMHLAETQEERQLLEQGTGPFAEMLQSFGLWEPGLFPRHSVIDYLDCLTAAPRVVVAHGNYFDEPELDFVATHKHVSIAYCARTHAHFGHAEHPWRKMQSRGINVALGTDSRGSNPDLAVWNEAVFLSQRDNVASQTLLAMLTENGSRALTGASEPISEGSPATFSVLQSQRPVTDLWKQLFRDCRPVNACAAGRWIDPAS